MKLSTVFNEMADELSRKAKEGQTLRNNAENESDRRYWLGFVDGIISANQDIDRLAAKIGHALLRDEKIEG